MSEISIERIKRYLLALQARICHSVEVEDGQQKFIIDDWQRQAGGGGRTCVLENGPVIEKGGVNFSHVNGENLPPSATVLRPELQGATFDALGVSVVIHPRNPYAPTVHLNVRFFIATAPSGQQIWWFGGGLDLTPYYGFAEDCVHWHQQLRSACLPFGEEVYPTYKKQCDSYFYLKHRQEARGIGGIFFDDLNAWGFETCFAFMQSVGDSFIPAYIPILTLRKNMAYDIKQREFQLYRRGRYVEFNLVFDRGTLFGLQSNGRTESILMSLPPHVQWRYDWQPAAGSEEEKLYTDFLPVRDWIE